jgi:hypothetical protein
MTPSFWTFLLSSILAVEPVFAGSRSWQPTILHTSSSDVKLNAGHWGRENSTNEERSTGLAKTLQKRYLTINPGTGTTDDRLWPNGKIEYCFESEATKELFFEDLVEARKLWEMSGLGAGFDWVEKDSA